MRNTMVKPKMSLLVVLLAKQEVAAFSCLQLIDSCRFLRQEVSLDAEGNGEIKMTSFPVLLPKQEVPAFSCL